MHIYTPHMNVYIYNIQYIYIYTPHMNIYIYIYILMCNCIRNLLTLEIKYVYIVQYVKLQLWKSQWTGKTTSISTSSRLGVSRCTTERARKIALCRTCWSFGGFGCLLDGSSDMKVAWDRQKSWRFRKVKIKMIKPEHQEGRLDGTSELFEHIWSTSLVLLLLCKGD